MNNKLLWTNEDIQYVFHENIMEYDMVAASVSICERFNLLNQETITRLKLLPKEKRTVQMGLLQKNDKVFSEQLLSGIKEIRRKFLETNKLDESNVLSLHSDAVIFFSRKKIASVIDGVEFKKKHTWSSYLRYKGIEMFYGDGHITYKNIPVDMLNQHTLGINKYLIDVFNKIDSYDPNVMKYLSKFQKQYLQDKLPEYFYIPFGRCGNYKMDNLELFALIANIAINEMKGW